MYLTYDCALLLIHIHSMHYNSSEGDLRVFVSYDMNLYLVIHMFSMLFLKMSAYLLLL